jgi:hypothetical protein
MSVPFQCTSRRRPPGRSLEPAIMLLLVFGLAGVYVQRPPLGPPGDNPTGPDEWETCPNTNCGTPVRRSRDGLYHCPKCYNVFDAADAND